MVRVKDEILAQNGQGTGGSGGAQVGGIALETWGIGQHGQTRRPAFVIGVRQCGWVKIRADNPAGGAGLFDFGNQGRVGFCLDGERVGKAAGRRSLAGEGVHFGQGDFALLGGDFGEFVGFYFV